VASASRLAPEIFVELYVTRKCGYLAADILHCINWSCRCRLSDLVPLDLSYHFNTRRGLVSVAFPAAITATMRSPLQLHVRPQPSPQFGANSHRLHFLKEEIALLLKLQLMQEL